MAPIETLAQRLGAVAETLRLSELIDFVVESSRVLSADRTPLPAACTLLIQECRGSPVSNTGRSERSMPCRVPAAPAMVRAPTELSAEDIGGIADACHACAARAPASNRLRTSPASGRRACPGFCAAADLDE